MYFSFFQRLFNLEDLSDKLHGLSALEVQRYVAKQEETIRNLRQLRTGVTELKSLLTTESVEVTQDPTTSEAPTPDREYRRNFQHKPVHPVSEFKTVLCTNFMYFCLWQNAMV